MIRESTMKGIRKINSIGFNNEKTKELIEQMKMSGVDVDIENLDKYLRTQGVLVKIHIGGGKHDFDLSPKVYGINSQTMGEDVKELFTEYVKSSKISFLPRAYLKRLKRIESAVRMSCIRLSIGYENSFMPLESYTEFKKYFDSQKNEYLMIRDEIMANYDELVKKFKDITKSSLKKMNAIDLESEYLSIVGRFGEIGTPLYESYKKRYESSFYMELGVKAFPVAENLQMFDSSVRKDIEEGLNSETIKTLYEVIGNILDDAFVSVGRILTSANNNNGVIAPKTMSSIKDISQRLSQKNILCNPKINEIRADILTLSSMDDYDFIYESAEKILAKIYKYALELNIDDRLNWKNSPIDEDLLVEIAEMLDK